MAGFIINIGKIGDKPATFALLDVIKKGVYLSYLNPQKNVGIRIFSDFLTVQPGDNIYFFYDRNFYGIGEVINVGLDCKYLNYPGADNFKIKPDISEVVPLIENEDFLNYPFLLTFKPSPYFFTKGIDMDALLSYHPERTRMIRVMENRTFMKIDDIENDNLKDFIIQNNADAYVLDTYDSSYHFSFDDSVHNDILNKLSVDNYSLSIDNIIKYSVDIKNPFELLKEEMLQAMVLYYLTKYRSGILGDWDFVTREYFASPFKIALWSDKMDIFAYKHVGNTSTIYKYLVIELKKSVLNENDVFQTLKYVDWVCKEFANGDYSMIEAYTIGLDYEDQLMDKLDDIISKKYVRGFRPYKPDTWKNLRLLKYTQLFDELNIPYKTNYANSLRSQLLQKQRELQEAQLRYDKAKTEYDERTTNGRKISQRINTELRISKNKLDKIIDKITPIQNALNDMSN